MHSKIQPGVGSGMWDGGLGIYSLALDGTTICLGLLGSGTIDGCFSRNFYIYDRWCDGVHNHVRLV